MKTPDLSIIIPAYQEAAIIRGSLRALSSWLKKHDYGVVEVIVVVAESPDGTAKLAEAEAARFEHFRIIHAGPRVGKGRDVRLGMLEAKGKYRLFMDADLATPLVHLDDVQWMIDRGGHVGVGVRNLWTIHNGLKRKVFSKMANILSQVILLPGLKDTQCGFKVFSAEATEKVFRPMTILKWGFDFEILALARRAGYFIYTFEIPDWRDPKAADGGLVGDSSTKAAIQTFQELLAVRRNLLLRKYRS